jgi:hypothetical protein
VHRPAKGNQNSRVPDRTVVASWASLLVSAILVCNLEVDYGDDLQKVPINARDHADACLKLLCLIRRPETRADIEQWLLNPAVSNVRIREA